MTGVRDAARRRRRGHERAERDRERRVRGLAITRIAALAASDPTLSGATLILPDGTAEYIDATAFRKRGQA